MFELQSQRRGMLRLVLEIMLLERHFGCKLYADWPPAHIFFLVCSNGPLDINPFPMSTNGPQILLLDLFRGPAARDWGCHPICCES